MPALDLYHDHVKQALINDGWTITHDPLLLVIGRKDLFVDLGAQKLFAAEKEGRKIAVEIKSFTGRSDVADLEQALGQYVLYRDLMAQSLPDQTLFLAISVIVFRSLFEEPIGKLVLRSERLKLIVFDNKEERILQWID